MMKKYLGKQIWVMGNSLSPSQSEERNQQNDSVGSATSVDIETESHDEVKDTEADTAIDNFVDKILANKNCNVSWIPDKIEKAMYRNVMHLVIGYIESITESVEIKVANHKITIAMEPIQSHDSTVPASSLQE